MNLTASGSTAIPVGVSSQLSLTGTMSDGSTQSIVLSEVAFSSSNPAVASVTDTGEVKAVGVGSTTITATYNGKTATLGYTVTAHQLQSIVINADHASIAKGTATEVSATGVYTDGNQDITTQVLFSSDNGNVSFSSGYDDNTVVYGNEVGTSNITASMNGVSSDPILFKVTSATLDSLSLTANGSTTLPKGVGSQLSLTGTMSDGSTQKIVLSEASFKSSNSAVLSVSDTGGVKAVGVGSATITATYNGKTATLSFTVTAHQLQSITINADHSSIAKGTATKVSATAIYSDGVVPITDDVVFSADNSNVSFSTASDNGVLAYGSETGFSEISASYMGMTSDKLTLHVTNATVQKIEVVGESTVVMGYSTQLVAELVLSDGTRQPATNPAWSSSNSNFNVTDTGLVTLSKSVGAGDYANIWVSANGFRSEIFKITATNATLLSVYININDQTGSNINLPLYRSGSTAVYLASVWGNFSDGSQSPIIVSPSWQYVQNNYFSVSGITLTAREVGGPVNLTATVTGSSIPGGSMTTPTVKVTITP